MIRKIKMVGLAAIAVLAVSAVGASAANAAAFTSPEGPGTVQIEGGQVGTHTFTYSGRVVTCETATFAGSASNPSNTATIDPNYENCHASVLGSILGVTVDFGDCDYTFYATEKDVFLDCGTGDVTITVYDNDNGEHTEGDEVCKYTIKEQTVGSISYTNESGDVKVGANSAVATTRVKGGALLCGPASGNSTYAGDTLVGGEDSEGNPVGIDVG